ncbi:MAG: M28 family peptidase [Flavobacteriales bacterium]
MRRLLFLSLVIFTCGCNPNSRQPAVVELADAPAFNADTAYHFITQQLAFGPRVPSTIGHQLCGDFLVGKLTEYGLSVTEQKDTIIGFNQRPFPLRNIICSVNPENKERILLCAHWDSRPYTDQDVENREDSLIGANDNASGVSVLLEIARNLGVSKPKIGIDLVFFDMEDQGRPAYDADANSADHGYCLGSKYWAENRVGVKPSFGILLDMVGAENAEFTMEGTSVKHAKSTLNQVWDLATQLGYSQNFRYNLTRAITDDHSNVIEIAEIPCIDIIQYDASTPTGFGKYWHTHNDNLSIIDKKTLKAVGHTLQQLLYNQGTKK